MRNTEVSTFYDTIWCVCDAVFSLDLFVNEPVLVPLRMFTHISGGYFQPHDMLNLSGRGDAQCGPDCMSPMTDESNGYFITKSITCLKETLHIYS